MATRQARPRRILLGVTGSIAAFKSPSLVRALRLGGANVQVILSEGAQKFVGAETFLALTGRPALTSLWGQQGRAYPSRTQNLGNAAGPLVHRSAETIPCATGEVHVDLADWADVMLVAPCTAHCMAQLAAGLCPDLLTTTALCLGSDKPLLVAPAMHPSMWSHPATRRNAGLLSQDGVEFLGPVEGPLASGQRGMGRMLEPEVVAQAVLARADARSASGAPASPAAGFGGGSSHAGDASLGASLAGKRVLITAGPTEEPIDPVRYLGNRSSGRMGIALAQAALAQGAQVELLLGPSALTPPAAAVVTRFRTTAELAAALEVRVDQADALIMAAAVADFRPSERFEHKHKRNGVWQLELQPNDDLLARIGASRRGKRPVLIGFALESEALVEHAQEKLERKGCDLIVANGPDTLGADDSRATLVAADTVESLGTLSKEALSSRIIARLSQLLP